MTTVADKANPPAPPGEAARDPRSTIAGRYQIDLAAPLGAGGLALVYRGQDLRTRRAVAVKTLRIEYRHDPETRAQFRREARLLAFLAHPNVVRVFDFVEDHGTSWVVMEHVPGRSLQAALAERGPLPPEAVAPLLDQAAAALGHLHSRNLVHLDVKPQNLLVTDDGRLKLIDFGLAQPAGGPQQTIAGRTFGTAAYLSPEQASGEAVDAATDVYALGCVVYELLTGRPPFGAGAPNDPKHDLVRAHLERAPDPPSSVRPDLALPRWVDDVLLWALAKDPAARYRTAESFARVFRAGVSGEGAGSPATTTSMALVDVPVSAPSKRPPAPTVSPAPLPGPTQGSGPEGAAWPPAAPVRPRPMSRALHRLLRRALLAVAAADALLALLLIFTQGALPGVYEPTAALRPGAEASVTLDDLLLRDGPGLDATPLLALDPGVRLTLTGDPIEADDRAWWPVRLAQDGAATDGYVAEVGLAPELPPTPLERLRGLLPALD